MQGAFEASLQRLKTEYVDLYLVHWPVKGKYVSVWKEMEKIYAGGKVRAIGVSNYLEHHLEELLKTASVIPAVDQIELHPYLTQEKLVNYLHGKNIVPEAWSPSVPRRIICLKNLFLKR